MRACSQRRQLSRVHMLWVSLIFVSQLLSTTTSHAQDSNASRQRSAVAPATLHLPDSATPIGEGISTGSSSRPIRNELRHPQSPSSSLRPEGSPNANRPATPSHSESMNKEGSLLSSPRASTGTVAQDLPQTNGQQPSIDAGQKGQDANVRVVVSGGSLNRGAAVAPPIPMNREVVPSEFRVTQSDRDVDATQNPSVHVIGDTPTKFELADIADRVQSESQTPEQKSSPSLRLAPPKEKRKESTSSVAASWAKPQVLTTVLSLAVVLASFFALTWFVRRSKPTASSKLPEEAVEILGRLPMEGRQQIQLVRFGRKLLLWVVTPNSVQTLSEITDPDDVDQLMEFCEASKRGSLSDSFRQVLNELGNEPTNRGFLSDRSIEEIIDPPSSHRGRGRRSAYEA